MANGSCLFDLQILGGVMVLALGGAGLYFGMFIAAIWTYSFRSMMQCRTITAACACFSSILFFSLKALILA
jgi:hypothetical protein